MNNEMEVVIFSEVVNEAGNKYFNARNIGRLVNVASTLYPPARLVSLGVLGGMEVYHYYADKKEKEMSKYVISDAEGISNLSFPQGDPIPGEVYVRHPRVKDVYLLAKDYHRYVFEERFYEMIKVIRAMGAREIRADVKGKVDRTLFSNISAEVFNAKGCSENNHGGSIFFEAKYAGVESVLPDDLIWFNHEKSWQELYESKGNVRTINQRLEYDSDNIIDAKILAVVRSLKVRANGGFLEKKSVACNLYAEF